MSALPNYALENHYDSLSKFESIKEFNNHFEQAMILHKDKFTKSEYLALNKLRKFAANFYGVAWCKIQKVVSSTHKDAISGISRSTFERMLRKAKKINLVTVINQERDNKWQKHNVYVFNRLEELRDEKVEIVSKSNAIDVPDSEKIEAPLTNLLLELSFEKKNNTYQQADSADKKIDNVIDLKKPLSEYTDYDHIKNLVVSCTSDKKLASKFYGIWLAQTSKLINKPSFELAMNAARATLRAMKSNDIKNPRGYFNNSLKEMIDKSVEQERIRYEKDLEQALIADGTTLEENAIITTQERPSLYNWLEPEKGPDWLFL